jgi:phosphoglycerol transferase MdoB-like AlkP superfamily enzyme
MGIIVILWALMLLHVQGESFCPSYSHGWVFQKFLFRMSLNFLFVLSLCLILPRAAVFFLIVLSAVCGLGLITYSRYFHETMSVLSLLNNFQEGTAVIDAIVLSIPFLSLFLFLIKIFICGVLLFQKRTPLYSYRLRSIAGVFCFAVYLMLIGVLSQSYDLRFPILVRDKEIGDLTVVYGYLPVWTAELFLKNENTLRNAALQQPQTDRLTPLETPLELPQQIVAVQVETLDFTIIDRRLNGKIVTPFLNELKKKSFFYKVNTFHYHGSADADFAFLSRREPSRHLLNYKIKTYPYENSLPHQFNKQGYKTYSFHNGNRLYFNRYSAFQKMGITNINFIEDLVEKYGVQTELVYGWSAVRDDVLFRIVSETVRTENNKSFFFVITLLGHAPFTAIKEKDIFPAPTNQIERYANTIHVLDKEFRAFYESLPTGTMVVVYGDHSSNIVSSEYTSRDSVEDCTPCMISIVGTSIANQQQTNPLFALSGQLSLVDISNYLWQRVQK